MLAVALLLVGVAAQKGWDAPVEAAAEHKPAASAMAVPVPRRTANVSKVDADVAKLQQLVGSLASREERTREHREEVALDAESADTDQLLFIENLPHERRELQAVNLECQRIRIALVKNPTGVLGTRHRVPPPTHRQECRCE